MKFPAVLILALSTSTNAFVPSPFLQQQQHAATHRSHPSLTTPAINSRSEIFMTATSTSSEQKQSSSSSSQQESLLTELRTTAMKLHTQAQSPREGQAPSPAKPSEPYVPTHDDYLQFLVDSHHVYAALEEVVSSTSKLERFRNTGLERTDSLEKDIDWMVQTYNLARPDVGGAGRRYAEELRNMVTTTGEEVNGVAEFMCHYYNFYFAHLAGGRMIGKQMSKLLLDGETLEFYKWGGDVNDVKTKVKDDIEEMAQIWLQEERDECINATAGAFRGGGAINGYLYGGNPH